MTDTDRLEHLTGEVRRSLGDGPAAPALREQRTEFLRRTSRFPVARPRRGWSVLKWALPAAGLAAAGALALPLWWHGTPAAVTPPPLVVRDPQPPLPGPEQDEFLRAPADAPLQVALGPEGDARLDKGTRGRLQRFGSDRGRVLVESGIVDVSVRDDSARRWSFYAGAYRVEVLGTAFRIDYRPSSDEVEVRVTRGRLQVSGGHLGSETVMVDANQRFLGSPDGVHLGPIPAATAQGPEVEQLPTGTAPAPDPVQLRSHRAIKSRGSALAWHDHYKTGDYKSALAAAQRIGFATLINNSPADGLLDLADTARLGGDGKRARDALLGLRRRFPRATEARTAAFLLGRLDADVNGDFRAAARWFEQYMRENPRGPYAPETQGRLIVAYQRTGQTARAQEAARHYLERQPDGPYVELARSLTGAAPTAR